MPKLTIDMFDSPPDVGDKVEITGKVLSIDEDTGDVRVSYDNVDVKQAKKRNKKRSDRSDDNFDEEMVNMGDQSLDNAIYTAFPDQAPPNMGQ